MTKTTKSKNQLLSMTAAPLNRTQIAKFAASINHFSPLFFDDHFANSAGFGGVIAPGSLALSLAEDYLYHVLGGEPISSIQVSFQRFMWPGEELTFKAQVNPESKHIEFEALNQRREVVLVGRASFEPV